MTAKEFRALVVRQAEDGAYTRSVTHRRVDDLPEGDLLIRVHYSSLNYKDALSASGNRGVTRNYPHTPGIDAAGVVEQSASDEFSPGDEVIVTGFDLGMNTAGGFGEYIRVPAAWAVNVPDTLTLRESMVYGTAGFTAALSIEKLRQHGVTADDGEILVTGATGGVGSIAVGLLARAGYRVVAATGKPDQETFLRTLGASGIVSREEVDDQSGKPFLRERWAGAIDTVGGNTLATLLKSTRYGGAIAACGNVGGAELNTTVFPFILRGVSLLGVDSVKVPLSTRRELWRRLGAEWRLDSLDALASERSLDALDSEIDRILQGRQVGRILVNLSN